MGAKRIFKKLYGLLPFKKQVFTAIRWFGTPPEWIYRHLHFKGIITVKISNTEQFRTHHHGYIIENELFWSGLRGWEGVSMELWTRLSRRSQAILDIGANTGIYALTAQAVHPSAKVLAIEPVARIFSKLRENASLNGNRVVAVHAAISDSTGTATLYDIPEYEHLLSVSLEAEWNKESTKRRPVEVPCFTVADLLIQQGMPRVDLLKIDVETHEAAVLRGFREILARDKPSMLIEILNDEVAKDVSALMDGLEYQYYNIDDVTWPPPQVGRLSKSGHFNFLVCQPDIARSIGLEVGGIQNDA